MLPGNRTSGMEEIPSGDAHTVGDELEMVVKLLPFQTMTMGEA